MPLRKSRSISSEVLLLLKQPEELQLEDSSASPTASVRKVEPQSSSSEESENESDGDVRL